MIELIHFWKQKNQQGWRKRDRIEGTAGKSSGVFSTDAMGAMATVILRKRLIAPAVSARNGKILLALGTRNIKILNTPLYDSQA